MVELKFREPMMKQYSFRVSEEEFRMIEFLRKKRVELPFMLRKHIKEVYGDMIREEDIDEEVYKL